MGSHSCHLQNSCPPQKWHRTPQAHGDVVHGMVNTGCMCISPDLDIACKELIRIILACATWQLGRALRELLLRQPSGYSQSSLTLEPTAKYDAPVDRFSFVLYPTYISTRLNHLADDTSRNHVSSFLSNVTLGNPTPMPIHKGVLELLLNQQTDWIWGQPCSSWTDVDATQKSNSTEYNILSL